MVLCGWSFPDFPDGCGLRPGCVVDPLLQSTRVRAQQADLILHGGIVLTMDDKHPSAGAGAVRDGKITATRSLEKLSSRKGPLTRTIDLAGKTLLPGFIDSHGHLIHVGLQRTIWTWSPGTYQKSRMSLFFEEAAAQTHQAFQRRPCLYA